MKNWRRAPLVITMTLLSLQFSVASAEVDELTNTQVLRLCEEQFRFENMDSRGMVSDQIPLTPESIALAYSRGFFPWVYRPTTGLSEWYASPGTDDNEDVSKRLPGLVRGFLDLNEFRLPRTLKKWLRKEAELQRYTITFNRAFGDVMRAAAEAERPGQDGTWITEEFVTAYEELNRRGIAQSVEVWRNGVLVGGSCGILSPRFFAGDSMFYREENAGKLAFLANIVKFKKAGLPWIDTQQVSAGTAPFGARQLPVYDFFDLLANTPENTEIRGLMNDPNEYRLVLQDDELVLVNIAEPQ